MAGLVPAIWLRKARLSLVIEIVGTSPAMTKESEANRSALRPSFETLARIARELLRMRSLLILIK